MSDFLRNLRSSHKKEAPTRKIPDGNYYPQTDRRSIMDRRTVTNSDPVETLAQQLKYILPEVLENTTTLADQVVKLTSVNELVAEAQIRQYTAVADFFTMLNKMISETGTADIPGESRPKVTASYASGTHYTKDDIMTIIRDMRKQGATYAIIADSLIEKGIPTFSNRGEWHAQTIHRLCK